MGLTISSIYFVDKPVINMYSVVGMGERKHSKKQEEISESRKQMMQKAYELYVNEGRIKADIVVELGISRPTLNLWLREMGAEEKRQQIVVPQEQKAIGANIDKFLDAALSDQLPPIKETPANKPRPEDVYDARVQERADIAQSAESNMTPGERYAAYVAAQGIRIIRDAIPGIRTPTTVKELEILDGIVRRNLGLDKKGGGGTLKIDVNILNNSKASPKGAVIDVPAQED